MSTPLDAGPALSLVLPWGTLDHETQAFGLAVPAGIVSTTGIGGLTLGGGFGWISPRFGLTCDNLLSADVVTADGELVTASEEQNPELFWGIRGGGGNFGIVTSFEYQMHSIGPTVLAGLVVHPMSKARELLRFYLDFLARAPRELGTVFALRIAPPAPFLPCGDARKAHGGHIRLLRRPGGRRRTRPAAPPAVWYSRGRCHIAEAVHHPPGHAGPHAAAGTQLLLEVRRPGGPQRRRNRHHSSPFPRP